MGLLVSVREITGLHLGMRKGLKQLLTELQLLPRCRGGQLGSRIKAPPPPRPDSPIPFTEVSHTVSHRRLVVIGMSPRIPHAPLPAQALHNWISWVGLLEAALKARAAYRK